MKNVRVYDNDELIAQATELEFPVKNLATGDRTLSADILDNDGVMSESNLLSFTVKSAMQVPGSLIIEDFRKGKSVSITNSTDSDGGKNIKSGYGFVDYPVQVAAAGNYHFKFRVPGSNGSKTVIITANGEEVAAVDVGNTGTAQAWFDVFETDVSFNGRGPGSAF